jgi:hypothetical protein
MLALVVESKRKKAAQKELERNLKRALQHQGVCKIGSRGGNIDLPLYSAGNDDLWAAFGGRIEGRATRRYWNAFGVYNSSSLVQSISVEINVPTETNGAGVAGFFAEDEQTGEIYLMHTGRVGGGRTGVGKTHFLFWSMEKLINVKGEDGGLRGGIIIGKLNAVDFVDRVREFVRIVQDFKDTAKRGGTQTSDFEEGVQEFDRYREEFSGRKGGVRRGGGLEYITYHGEIVRKLRDERRRLRPGAQASNTPLIDLLVKMNGVCLEMYEVKTGAGRQMLYTAIGQILTHAASKGGEVAKYLVIPADETIPQDLEQAIAVLGIKLRRFRLQRKGRRRFVELM